MFQSIVIIRRSRINSPFSLEGKLDFELFAEAVLPSLMTRKNSSFVSLGTCFDLFLYRAVRKEKLNFKEKHRNLNSLIEEFLSYSNEVFMLRKCMEEKH